MTRKVIEVFLSSTAKDLSTYRAAVHDRLMRTGIFHCIWQEDFGAQDSNAVEFCRKQAQACDMFVGLIGLRRGWEPDGDNKKRSITEMEYDWAKEAGRPRYLWATPDEFKVSGNLREPDDQHARQVAFRQRVMAGGERIISQKGFESEQLLASEIVEHLLTQIVTGDLIAHVRPELVNQNDRSVEEQIPAIAAAVEKLVEDKDVDLLALAKNPKGSDLVDLEAKLKARAQAYEIAGQLKTAQGARDLKASAEYWRHIGALAFLHDTQKAFAAYERAVRLDPDHPDGWRYLGLLYFRLGDLTAAEKVFGSLLELGQRTKDKEIELMGFFHLVQIYGSRGDLGRAEETQLKMLKLSEETGNKAGLPGAYINLGYIHHSRGNLHQAKQSLVNALRLSQELGSKVNMAISYSNLGIIHETCGDLQMAEEMFLKALDLNEELGRKEGIAASYGNLAIVYQDRGELAKAEEMQLKSKKLYEELENKEGMATVYGSLGLIYSNRGEQTKAEEMLLKALELNLELDRKEGIATAYTNLGNIYEAHGDLTRAEKMQLGALALFKQLGSKDGMASAYANLGNVYAATRAGGMCECWRQALKLWREMGLMEKAKQVERRLTLYGCDT